jgi:hypothetical protein
MGETDGGRPLACQLWWEFAPLQHDITSTSQQRSLSLLQAKRAALRYQAGHVNVHAVRSTEPGVRGSKRSRFHVALLGTGNPVCRALEGEVQQTASDQESTLQPEVLT